MIKKKNLFNVLILFLGLHLTIWTLIPTFSNTNLPLDTIEALAWGSNIEWGFNKHPPLSAFVVEIFYKIFGNNDWAYYFLSQLFVITSFFLVWKFSEEFFEEKIYSLFSVLLLEGIYFYNFTTPEFNVNVCQLPFWAGTAYFFWKAINDNKNINWILFGLFAGFGFLSKYLFVYLLAALIIFFLFKVFKQKKFNTKCFISLAVFILVISPHLLWLSENNYSTVLYGIKRTGLENVNYLKHLTNPFIFLFKQIGILVPTILMTLTIVSKFNLSTNLKDKKLQFLIFSTFLPILLLLITSIITGAKIRTMWLTPFYLFLGTFLIYFFKNKIKLKKMKKFIILFSVFFILSPAAYLYISITQTTKRTDYPGREIAYLVQSKWNNNFSNEIEIVVGDEWFGGNLSYHLASRPKWYNTLNQDILNKEIKGGFVYVGNPKILKKVCPGVFGTIKPVGICMIGSK
jgi:4-amino-4-deoxy-L-arabinose transferase-like glycosyltransferase